MSARRRLTTLLSTVALASTLAALVPTAAHAAVPVLRLDGTGHGHGVGLSQWGAEFMARGGRTTDQILGTFYPGAGLGTGSGTIRVAVRPPGTSTTTVSFPQGGEMRSPAEGPQAPGFPLQVAPGGRVRITYDGTYRVDGVMSAQGAGATRYRAAASEDPCLLGVICGTTTQPPPVTTTTTAPPSSEPPPTSGPGPTEPGGPSTSAPPPSASSPNPVWAVPASGGVTTVDERGRSYRGVIEATGGGALRLVNALGVEDYLRGMAEVPGNWPAPAVQAQTIAARTYALRAMGSGGELCDDARCQVYVGRQAETAGQDAAVAATAGKVVTFGGALAAAVYSADAGGVSATPFEGFGTPDGTYPYLTTVRYDTDNPLPWQLVVSLDAVRARFRYPGTLSGVRVGETGPSDRALTLVLEGSAGDRSVDGRQFARSLGLRSTRFAPTIEMSDGTPPPLPEVADEIQALPEETAALARQPVARPGVDKLDTAVGEAGAFVPDLPAVVDDRRRLILLAASVLLAGVAGAGAPLLWARESTGTGARVRARLGRARAAAGARGLAAWRTLGHRG